MARRPFDPAATGLTKTEYHQGDVLDREAVDALVADADVVVHLAFIIVGGIDESREINLTGSRNVFEAAAAADRVKRLVYTSSVAAYGFHEENPQPLTENVETRGTEAHYYSAQKAELEGVLERALKGSGTDAYVFRPCIVAGPEALTMIEEIPYVQAAGRLPGPLRALLGVNPLLKPVIPDPGVPFQLVHHDDVATALLAATLGRGQAGASTTSRARGRSPRPTSPRRSAGTPCRSPSSPSTRRRSSSAGCPSRRPGPVDQRRPRAGDHGHEPRPPGAGLAPAPPFARDPRGDGGGGAARGPRAQLTGAALRIRSPRPVQLRAGR
jgi:uncharacterized protein YbjT (DUF2867 family)